MRSRNIKPSLFANEFLGTSDPFLTILFEGLWCLADREGLVENRPLKIKAMVFPYRNFTEAKVKSFLSILEAEGFIRTYEAEGQKVIKVVHFLDHQSPHSTERESKLPPEPVLEVQEIQQDTGQRKDTESLTQIPPNSGIQESENQESGIRNQESETLSSDDEIFAYWRTVHDKPRAQFTIERKRKVRERLVDSTPDEIKQAIDGCRVSPYHQGHNDRGTIYDDLELICRSRTQLEKFITYGKRVPRNGNNIGKSTAPPPEYKCQTCFDLKTITHVIDNLNFEEQPCPDCTEVYEHIEMRQDV